MLKKTYDKVCELFEEGNGYLPTRTLLNNKITTIQIRTMLCRKARLRKCLTVITGT